MTNGNGGAAQTPPQGQAQGQPVAPQINIFAQYVKDLSFENPHAPRSLTPSGKQPEINIQVNVSANPLQDGNVECVLKIDGKAVTSGTVLFNFELTYAGVFRIQNVPQESMHAVVMIECPRLLFPFAREIIASSVNNGGFPPLLLDPIDFVNLYRQNMAQPQAAPPATPTAQA